MTSSGVRDDCKNVSAKLIGRKALSHFISFLYGNHVLVAGGSKIYGYYCVKVESKGEGNWSDIKAKYGLIDFCTG